MLLLELKTIWLAREILLPGKHADEYLLHAPGNKQRFPAGLGPKSCRNRWKKPGG
jgi:hypothetical protein